MLQKLAFPAVASVLLAPFGRAQIYYSVDVTNDALCAVNIDSGQVSYLGPLLADLDVVDLTWHMGALYAQTMGTPVGNKIYQIVVDGHYLGFGLQGGTLNGGGYTPNVGALGGIASNGTTLHLAYSKSNPNNNYSRSFGTVQASWAGLIAPAAPDVGNTVHDIDGLAFAGGEFWGIDVLQPGTGYELHRTSGPGTPVSTLVGGETAYDVTTNPVDLEVVNTEWFVAVTSDGKHLIRIKRADGTRGTHMALLGLQTGGVLQGIARRPDPCPRFLGFPVNPISHP